MLRKFDLFPKLDKQYRVGTSLGGFLSVLSVIMTVILFYSEIWTYFHPPLRQNLIVDSTISTATDGRTISSLSQPKLQVTLDVSFPEIPCYLLHFDVIDPVTHSLMHIDEIDSHFYRLPKGSVDGKDLGTIDPQTFYQSEQTQNCGNCYSDLQVESGKENCCDTCVSVFEFHQKHSIKQPLIQNVAQCKKISDNIETMKNEGCRVRAEFKALRIQSEFHVSPGFSWGNKDINFHDVSPFGLNFSQLNLSHKINELKFTSKLGSYPLDNFVGVQHKEKSYRFIYNIDILDDNFTATYFQITDPLGYSPGFVVHYDISPVSGVTYSDREPLLHLCTRLLTVIGAVLGLFRAIDKTIFSVRHNQYNDEIPVTPSNVK